MKKKRLIALLLAVVLCVGLLPVSASAVYASVDWVDGVDAATGKLTKKDLDRNGEYAESSADSTTWSVKYYIVQKDQTVTIRGDLTLTDKAMIILCENSKLIVTGSLILNSRESHIYGQTSEAGETGTLIVQNTKNAGAAVRSESGESLYIDSGKLELDGGTSGQITDGKATLHSNSKITKGTLDGEEQKLSAWNDKASLAGSKLVLEYCDHPSEEIDLVTSATDNMHDIVCTLCGFSFGEEECDFTTGVGKSAGDAGHYGACDCGRQSTTILPHKEVYTLTDGGWQHAIVCQNCDYRKPGSDSHTWVYDSETGKNTGKCSVCGFMPVAEDESNCIYGSVTDALESVAASGSPTGYVLLLSYVETPASDVNKIWESVVFDAPGKSVELKMNGYTLIGNTDPTLTVKNGTLTVTGDATITQPERFPDTAASAVVVTGGRLVFQNDLTAEVGIVNGNRKPAVEATGGEIEFNGKLKLGGGLTLLKDAKLTKLLSQGFFWSGDGTNQDTLNDRIDLWGGSYANKSKHYTALSDILENGYALAYCDMDGNPTLEDGSYKFYGLFGNEASSVNVTIVEHPQHTWESLDEDRHYCTACKTRAAHTLENGVCSVCGYTCPHSGASLNTETGNYECSACGMTMVARSEKDGTTTYYSDLRTALETAETGSTITLLADATPRGADIYGDSTTRKVLTLNLNGHSVTSESFTISIGEKYIPHTGKNEYYPATLKIIGTGDLKAPIAITFNSTLDLSEWTGAHIQYVGVNNEGSVLIGPSSAAATIDSLWLSSWGYGKQGTLRLSGGVIGMAYSNSFDSDNKPTYPYGSFLLPGYAFKQNGAYLNYTDVLPYREEVYNLSVVPCPHGNLAPDSDGKLRCGYCNADMSGFAAEITCKDGSTGYSSDPHADGFYRAEAVKVKLLKNFDDFGTVNHAMTIDLNGKTIKSLSITAAGVKIIDSGTTKGSIGTLTVTADGVTLRDLLADGCGFRSTDGTWVAEGAATASNVTIAEVPIKEVCFYDSSSFDNRITALTKTYGEERTLYAHWSLSGNQTVTHKWEVRSGENGSWELLEDAGGTSCTVPAFAYAGTYTYRFTVTCDGYSKSADITVTVNKADIANTTVKLLNDEIMFTPDPRTGAGTEVTAQVTGISFKTKGLTEGEDYTVSDNTGTNVGDYTLTITAAPGSKKFAGTKKVSWKITPFTLGYFKLPWSIEKDYDGTTALPNKPRDWFTDGFENRTTLLPESSTIYLKAGNLYTYSATYVDANAGEGKEINATFQLTSDNYRFASDLTGVSADGKTLTLENWQNVYPKFNINKIDMPNFDKTVAATVVNDLARTYEIALPALPALTAPREYGTITYAIEGTNLTNGYEAATAQLVKDGEQYKLSLTVPAVQFAREESVGTITVKVTTANYNDVTLTVNVNTTNKLQPTVTASADPNSFTYGTKLGDVKLTASATYNGHTVEGTIAWDDPADTILDKGIYEKAWTFTPTDGSTYREVKGKLDIQVTKATLTGAPVFGKITETGKTLNDVQIDFSGILGVNGEQLSIAFGWTDDRSTVIEANKSYGWTIDAGNNYELLTGSTVLYPYSSGYSDQVKKQSEEYEAKKRGELPETGTFTDVDENDYFFDAVEWAAENGITGGVSAERFGAALDCSRAQTMTFLWRAMGEPEPGSYDPALTDVKNGSYYYDAVLWAMQEGVTTGMGKNLFSPDATVTRGQFVTFLYRLSGEKSDAAHPFTDVPAGSYYEPAIAWAYSKGITTGTSKTAFSPDAPCTRAQIITFLYRYFNQK